MLVINDNDRSNEGMGRKDYLAMVYNLFIGTVFRRESLPVDFNFMVLGTEGRDLPAVDICTLVCPLYEDLVSLVLCSGKRLRVGVGAG